MRIEGPVAVFDLETTGVDVETDRIVTAYLGIIRGDTIETVVRALVNPGIPIPEGATAVHGITNEVASTGADPAEVSAEIEAHLAAITNLGIPLVIMNAPYDLTLLDREVSRYHDGRPLSFTPARVIDPVVLDKATDPYRRGRRTLTDLAAHYGVPIPDGGAHNAEVDALTAAGVAREILTGPLFPDETNIDDVHRWSRAWRARQTVHIREYHAGQGNPIDPMNYRASWPIHPRPHHAVVEPGAEGLKIVCPECESEWAWGNTLADLELRARIHNAEGGAVASVHTE